jgi:winged helix DNA-binding protein
MQRIGTSERRARLGARHRLAAGARAADPAEVARSLVGVHGTDPSSVYLGILARMTGGGLDTVERALYHDRTLIRVLGMRRTVFAASIEVAPIIQAACGRAVAAAGRRQLLRWLADADLPGDVSSWLDEAERAALSALIVRGSATAAEIAGDDPRLGTQLVLAGGTSSEGRVSVASRVLALLAADGKVVRARPRGSWTSHLYRWAPMTVWCPQGLDEWATADAETELARQWLHAYGPATAEDLRWWAGWNATQLRRALSGLQLTEVDLDGMPGIVLSEDREPCLAAEAWAALLPALDSTPMGWSQRDWFLGDHGPKLFDRTGNIGPTVWWDGRIVGGWAQDSAGQIVCRFLEDVGSDAAAAVDAAAARLAVTLGSSRLTPRTRGRTWLEQELAG